MFFVISAPLHVRAVGRSQDCSCQTLPGTETICSFFLCPIALVHILPIWQGIHGTLRWEFIKENKKVRKQENKYSTKKAIKKKRKQELDQEKKEKTFFLDPFLSRVLVFIYKFPPQESEFFSNKIRRFKNIFFNSHKCPRAWTMRERAQFDLNYDGQNFKKVQIFAP